MKDNKTKGINTVDAVFIIGIAVVVLAVAVLSLWGKIGGNSGDTMPVAIKYVLEVQNREPQVLDYMKVGQTVYDNGSQSPIGEVTAIKKRTATTLVEDHEKKTLVEKEIANKVTFEVEIEANGVLTEDCVEIEDINILIGKGLDCVIGDAIVSGYIIGLDYENAEETEEEAQR